MSTKFELYYINLDSAIERRAAIERSILTSGFSDRWSFYRYAAVKADSELVQNTKGRNSDPYKGNFHSHMECLRIAGPNDAHLFIAEDDAMFCTQSGPLIEQVIDSLPEDSWDILRTEIALMSAADIPKFYKLCISEVARKKVQLLNLKGFEPPYAGASAYIVNRRSKFKIYNLIRHLLAQKNWMYDTPYDAYLHDIVRFGLVSGFVTVPFLTAPSFHEDISQAPQMFADRPLSDDEAIKHFNKTHREMQTAFRRLVWVGFTPDTVVPPGYEHGNLHFRMTDQDRLYQKISSWFLMLQPNIPYRTDHELSSFSIERPLSRV